ncbi:YrvL family regulatory protein [Lentibacillus jeotgali]|uniref:YrvL family regulatory protein n=1 Tax=Lentibacillus jeotgali TaxID=558169 RepID=UPI0002629320|nr:YrvL family regulatory protein [Lentibacillus jeotgali]
MSQHNNNSFKNMSLKEKTATVIGMTLLTILIAGFVLGIYFFGFAGVFELLGVQYQSIWSLVIFVVSFFVLGFLIDLPFEAMSKLSVEKLTGNIAAFLVELFFGFASNWIALVTVDVFVGSIELSLEAKLIISLLLAVLEPVFDSKNEKNEKVA